jgi:Fe(3+) dicitrate transport protein
MRTLFLLALFSIGAGAQQASPALEVSVVDPAGAAVAASGELTAKGGAGGSYAFRASAAGEYRFAALPAGEYQLRISAAGFEELRAEVTVGAGGGGSRRFVLQVAPMASSIVVNTLPRNLDGVPGTTAELTAEDLAALRPFSVKEAVRRMAGFHIVDEDAFGLNLNIGLRGLNPRRSQRTMLMEDGAPVHLAPYGDPSGHYHTPPEITEGIEAIKGSGQILHGPQTVGGMLNFRTAAVPEKLRARLQAVVGNRDYRSFMGQAGNTWGRVGLLGSFVHREGDGVRIGHGHRVDQGLLKTHIRISPAQTLLLKGGYYQEESRYSEGGMSQAQFAANPLGNPFGNDRFQLDRITAQAIHTLDVTEGVRLSTNLYYQKIDRTSYRQIDFPFDEMTAVAANGCTGAARVDYENFASRCGNKIRPRGYEFFGVEPRLSWRGRVLGMRAEGVAGVRIHQEWISRKRFNGFRPDGREDDANIFFRDWNEIRVQAFPFFVQNTFTAGHWSFTPGLRVETIRLRNRGLRRNNAAIDVVAGDNQVAVLPGFGLTYAGMSRAVLFAGIHSGFAPPRPDDNFDPTDSRFRPVSAERSTNSEFGVRSDAARGLRLEAAFYRIDFRNQIVPGESVGLPQFTWANAGRTLNQGVETSARWEMDRWLPAGHSLALNVAYTRLIVAKFNSDQLTDGVNVRGNRLPYAPGHLFHPGVFYRHRKGWNGSVSWDSISRQFADGRNRTAGSVDGMTGLIPGFSTLQASFAAPVGESGFEFFVSGANLTDRRYIVSRVDGIHVGRPRQVMVGIRYAK